VKNSPAVLRIGDAVRVRRQPWRVVDVRPGDGCRVVTLAGIGTLNAGLERRVITPFDVVEPERRRSRGAAPLRIVGMRRWRFACRAILSTPCTSGSVTTAVRARIDLHPYQLEPALAVVRGLGSRVLIADEVGLGKTIQAGLLISELRSRGAADRVLVVSPAGLREQWATELKERFGIDAVVMDTQEGRRRAAILAVGLDPWSTVPVAIASIDYVKRPEVLASVRTCRWDAVVVDEAHGTAAASERHDAVHALCGVAEYVILLTATPHNGDERAFRALCDLGARDRDPLLIFRRSRQEIALGSGRRIHRLHVRPTAPERVMHDALADLARAVLAEHDGTDRAGRDGRLALSVLYKRALSSAYALEQSASRRVRSLVLDSADVGQQLALPLDDETGELDPADAAPAFGGPLGPLLKDEAAERRLLERVAGQAFAAIPEQAKIAALRRLLRRLEKLGERAIVFTEYRDTLLHVRDAVRPRAVVVVVHGGMTAEERHVALEAFVTGNARLLLATDAAGEGLNLQRTCRVVVNLELPWNPMRLEQRIGRVDRIGQTRRVHVFHLIASDTREEWMLERLKRRLAQAGTDLGAPDPLGLDEADRPPDVAGIRLLAEAKTEYNHLKTTRATATSSCHVEAGVLAARTHRRQVRVGLASRALVIVRTSLDDAAGRSIAVHVAALALDTSRTDTNTPGRLRAIQLALSRFTCADLESLDPTLLHWHAASRRMHRRFWQCRADRDRAIARALEEIGHPPIQAGLFDHRSEHRRATDANVRRALLGEMRSRIAAAERAADIHLEPPRPVLLLEV
jgi:superfamily II DNA or RNA helicase